jgi:hypothetical protein
MESIDSPCPSESSAATRSPACLNCGTELQGEWCHHCGQPVKSIVRNFAAVFGDILDTLFEYDNRIWRTLAQLYTRPGYVTNDFIAGRRMRYVLPFRLFFVLSVVTFLALQLLAGPQNFLGTDRDTVFSRFDSVEEVEAERSSTLAQLEQAMAEIESGPGGTILASGMQNAMQTVNDAADRRIAELTAETAAPLSTESAQPPSPTIRFNANTIWDPETSPVRVSWFSDGMNRRVNQWMQQAVNNIERAGNDPSQLVDAMLNLLPLALFLLMPIFALLLKILYLFRRRLYMEHLIVALHSHSFLFLGILVTLVLMALRKLTEDIFIAGELMSLLYMLALLWLPVYLLLMQKSVYAQSWPVTVIKYLILGSFYSAMILVVLVLAAIISLINM